MGRSIRSLHFFSLLNIRTFLTDTEIYMQHPQDRSLYTDFFDYKHPLLDRFDLPHELDTSIVESRPFPDDPYIDDPSFPGSFLRRYRTNPIDSRDDETPPAAGTKKSHPFVGSINISKKVSKPVTIAWVPPKSGGGGGGEHKKESHKPSTTPKKTPTTSSSYRPIVSSVMKTPPSSSKKKPTTTPKKTPPSSSYRPDYWKKPSSPSSKPIFKQLFKSPGRDSPSSSKKAATKPIPGRDSHMSHASSSKQPATKPVPGRDSPSSSKKAATKPIPGRDSHMSHVSSSKKPTTTPETIAWFNPFYNSSTDPVSPSAPPFPLFVSNDPVSPSAPPMPIAEESGASGSGPVLSPVIAGSCARRTDSESSSSTLTASTNPSVVAESVVAAPKDEIQAAIVAHVMQKKAEEAAAKRGARIPNVANQSHSSPSPPSPHHSSTDSDMPALESILSGVDDEVRDTEVVDSGESTGVNVFKQFKTEAARQKVSNSLDVLIGWINNYNSFIKKSEYIETSNIHSVQTKYGLIVDALTKLYSVTESRLGNINEYQFNVLNDQQYAMLLLLELPVFISEKHSVPKNNIMEFKWVEYGTVLYAMDENAFPDWPLLIMACYIRTCASAYTIEPGEVRKIINEGIAKIDFHAVSNSIPKHYLSLIDNYDYDAFVYAHYPVCIHWVLKYKLNMSPKLVVPLTDTIDGLENTIIKYLDSSFVRLNNATTVRYVQDTISRITYLFDILTAKSSYKEINGLLRKTYDWINDYVTLNDDYPGKKRDALKYPRRYLMLVKQCYDIIKPKLGNEDYDWLRSYSNFDTNEFKLNYPNQDPDTFIFKYDSTKDWAHVQFNISSEDNVLDDDAFCTDWRLLASFDLMLITPTLPESGNITNEDNDKLSWIEGVSCFIEQSVKIDHFRGDVDIVKDFYDLRDWANIHAILDQVRRNEKTSTNKEWPVSHLPDLSAIDKMLANVTGGKRVPLQSYFEQIMPVRMAQLKTRNFEAVVTECESPVPTDLRASEWCRAVKGMQLLFSGLYPQVLVADIVLVLKYHLIIYGTDTNAQTQFVDALHEYIDNLKDIGDLQLLTNSLENDVWDGGEVVQTALKKIKFRLSANDVSRTFDDNKFGTISLDDRIQFFEGIIKNVPLDTGLATSSFTEIIDHVHDTVHKLIRIDAGYSSYTDAVKQLAKITHNHDIFRIFNETLLAAIGDHITQHHSFPDHLRHTVINELLPYMTVLRDIHTMMKAIVDYTSPSDRGNSELPSTTDNGTSMNQFTNDMEAQLRHLLKTDVSAAWNYLVEHGRVILNAPVNSLATRWVDMQRLFDIEKYLNVRIHVDYSDDLRAKMFGSNSNVHLRLLSLFDTDGSMIKLTTQSGISENDVRQFLNLLTRDTVPRSLIYHHWGARDALGMDMRWPDMKMDRFIDKALVYHIRKKRGSSVNNKRGVKFHAEWETKLVELTRIVTDHLEITNVVDFYNTIGFIEAREPITGPYLSEFMHHVVHHLDVAQMQSLFKHIGKNVRNTGVIRTANHIAFSNLVLDMFITKTTGTDITGIIKQDPITLLSMMKKYATPQYIKENGTITCFYACAMYGPILENMCNGLWGVTDKAGQAFKELLTLNPTGLDTFLKNHANIIQQVNDRFGVKELIYLKILKATDPKLNNVADVSSEQKTFVDHMMAHKLTFNYKTRVYGFENTTDTITLSIMLRRIYRMRSVLPPNYNHMYASNIMALTNTISLLNTTTTPGTSIVSGGITISGALVKLKYILNKIKVKSVLSNDPALNDIFTNNNFMTAKRHINWMRSQFKKNNYSPTAISIFVNRSELSSLLEGKEFDWGRAYTKITDMYKSVHENALATEGDMFENGEFLALMKCYRTNAGKATGALKKAVTAHEKANKSPSSPWYFSNQGSDPYSILLTNNVHTVLYLATVIEVHADRKTALGKMYQMSQEMQDSWREIDPDHLRYDTRSAVLHAPEYIVSIAYWASMLQLALIYKSSPVFENVGLKIADMMKTLDEVDIDNLKKVTDTWFSVINHDDDKALLAYYLLQMIPADHSIQLGLYQVACEHTPYTPEFEFYTFGAGTRWKVQARRNGEDTTYAYGSTMLHTANGQTYHIVYNTDGNIVALHIDESRAIVYNTRKYSLLQSGQQAKQPARSYVATAAAGMVGGVVGAFASAFTGPKPVASPRISPAKGEGFTSKLVKGIAGAAMHGLTTSTKQMFQQATTGYPTGITQPVKSITGTSSFSPTPNPTHATHVATAGTSSFPPTPNPAQATQVVTGTSSTPAPNPTQTTQVATGTSTPAANPTPLIRSHIVFELDGLDDDLVDAQFKKWIKLNANYLYIPNPKSKNLQQSKERLGLSMSYFEPGEMNQIDSISPDNPGNIQNYIHEYSVDLKSPVIVKFHSPKSPIDSTGGTVVFNQQTQRNNMKCIIPAGIRYVRLSQKSDQSAQWYAVSARRLIQFAMHEFGYPVNVTIVVPKYFMFDKVKYDRAVAPFLNKINNDKSTLTSMMVFCSTWNSASFSAYMQGLFTDVTDSEKYITSNDDNNPVTTGLTESPNYPSPIYIITIINFMVSTFIPDNPDFVEKVNDLKWSDLSDIEAFFATVLFNYVCAFHTSIQIPRMNVTYIDASSTYPLIRYDERACLVHVTLPDVFDKNETVKQYWRPLEFDMCLRGTNQLFHTKPAHQITAHYIYTSLTSTEIYKFELAHGRRENRAIPLVKDLSKELSERALSIVISLNKGLYDFIVSAKNFGMCRAYEIVPAPTHELEYANYAYIRKNEIKDDNVVQFMVKCNLLQSSLKSQEIPDEAVYDMVKKEYVKVGRDDNRDEIRDDIFCKVKLPVGTQLTIPGFAGENVERVSKIKDSWITAAVFRKYHNTNTEIIACPYNVPKPMVQRYWDDSKDDIDAVFKEYFEEY
jgi:hypothetical protein